MKRRHLVLAALSLAAFTASSHADNAKAGKISVGHPFARATLTGQPSGGVFMALDNRGPDDKLLGAAVGKDIADRAELHVMQMEGDVMRMREVDGFELPSNTVTPLRPGGSHIMLMGLKGPLKEGARFPMTLRFRKAGEVKVTVTVEALKPAAGASDGHMHKH